MESAGTAPNEPATSASASGSDSGKVSGCLGGFFHSGLTPSDIRAFIRAGDGFGRDATVPTPLEEAQSESKADGECESGGDFSAGEVVTLSGAPLPRPSTGSERF